LLSGVAQVTFSVMTIAEMETQLLVSELQPLLELAAD
jgi:hypothetical protein